MQIAVARGGGGGLALLETRAVKMCEAKVVLMNVFFDSNILYFGETFT